MATLMDKRYARLLKEQSRVKVVASAYRVESQKNGWLVALAFCFAGVFYFFGETLWQALNSG
jgi:hypothetical protein